MLSRLSSGRGSVQNALFKQAPLVCAASRGMATEQQLKMRINSIASTQKITRAMQMVAAAKLRRSQNALDITRVFTEDITNIWPDPEKPELKDGNRLILGITSDKGLCGAVNSSVIRSIRERLLVNTKPEDMRVVLFGDKARLGLERLFSKQLVWGMSDLAVAKNFTQVSKLVDYYLDIDFNHSEVVYNYFQSMIAYDTRTVPFYAFDVVEKDWRDTFEGYQLVGDNDALRNFYEFRTACRIYGFMAETETSELSARMQAMSNSTKNAGEILDALRVLYNRTRQAKITTELIEIISGAAAAEEGQKSTSRQVNKEEKLPKELTDWVKEEDPALYAQYEADQKTKASATE